MAFSDVLQTLGRVIGLFPGDNQEDDPRGGAVYNDYMPEDSYQEQPEEPSYEEPVYESGYGDSGAYGRAGARLKPQPRRAARAERERAQQQAYQPRPSMDERPQRPANVIDRPERETVYESPLPKSQPAQSASAVIFCVRRVEDTTAVIDYLMNGQNVILNFEDVDDLLFRRVLDMVSGASFVLNGEVGRISRRIYLVAPNGVKIVRPESNARASRGNNNPPPRGEEAAGYGAW